MKRSREDDDTSSQTEQRFVSISSREEPSEKPQMWNGARQRLIINNAMAYYKAVKDVFRDKIEKYHDFLQVMRDFNEQSIDVKGVVVRVKEVFKGHDDLILAFNFFLPKKYEITLTSDNELPPKKRHRKMLINFAEEEHDGCLTNADYDERRHGAKENNCSNYDDDSDGEHLSNKRKFVDEDISSMKRMKRSWEDASTSSQPKQPLVWVSRGKPTGQPQMRSDHGQGLTRSDAIAYIEAIKDTFLYKQEKYIYFMQIMRDLMAGRIEITCVKAKLKELFKGHEDLILRFNPFLPNGCKFTLPLEDEQPPQNMPFEFSEEELDRCLTRVEKYRRRCGAKEKNHIDHDQDSSREHLSRQGKSRCMDSGDGDESFGMHPNSSAFEDTSSSKSRSSQVSDYLKEAKELQNPEDFQEFLKYLHIYSKEVITRQELQLLAGNLLGKYADLIDGFGEFLAQLEKTEIFRHEGHGPKPMKVEDRDRDHDQNDKMKESDNKCQQKDKSDESNVTAEEDISVPKLSPHSYNYKYGKKPISELDLCNGEQCTSSCCVLPKTCPIASQKTELGAEVLDDH